MGNNVHIEGFEELVEKLDGMVDPAKIRMAMGKACAQVEKVAKMKAPKQDGELRRSITSRIEGQGSNTVGIVFSPLEFAPYVEYGTGMFAEGGKGRKEVPWVYVEGHSKKPSSKRVYTEEEADQTVAYLESKGLDAVKTYGQHPQPYLRPALNENREEIKRILKGAILKDD